MVSSNEEDTAVEMWDEPRHQLIFSMDNIRLLLVNVPAGDTSLLHKHEYATTYIILEDAMMTGRMADGEWSAPRQRHMRAAGRVVNRADYSAKPFAHQVRNVSSNTFTVFGLVNTHPGQYQPGPGNNVDNGLLVDNDWFKEHRFDLSAGEVTETLQFSFPTVVVQVSNGRSDVLNQHSSKTLAGAWSVHKAGEIFQLRNTSDKLVKLVLMEMK
jgi:hypothetical protein